MGQLIVMECPLCQKELLEKDRNHEALAFTKPQLVAIVTKLVTEAALKHKEQSGELPPDDEIQQIFRDTMIGILNLDEFLFYCPNKGYVLIEASPCDD